jgi:hypothetical protein
MQITKKLNNLKKYLPSLILFLVLSFSSAYAGYGKGKLTITENGVRGFYKYLQGEKGKPIRAVVTSDGNHFFWKYCAYAQCKAGGDTEAIKYCESKQPLPCATFAVGRSVKWKNGTNPGGKAAAFKKSMTIDEVRDKLAALGFLAEDHKTDHKTKEEASDNTKGIADRLESLTSLYEKGLLTESEFKKAKEKLLKK